MKKMRYNRILIIGICLLLCLNIFSIVKSSLYFTEDFDGYVTGSRISDWWGESYIRTYTGWSYASFSAYSGGINFYTSIPNCFRYSPSYSYNHGQFNLTITDINSISFNMQLKNGSISPTRSPCIGLNYSSNRLVYAGWSQGLGGLYLVCGDNLGQMGSYRVAWTSGMWEWVHVIISFPTNVTCNIKFNNITTGHTYLDTTMGMPYKSTQINRLDFFYSVSPAAYDYLVIDDLYFNYGAGGPGSCDLSIYDSKGDTSTICGNDGVPNKCIETRYNIPISTTLYGVDLLVTDIHDLDAVLSHYSLWVNGNYESNPCLYESVGYGYSIFRWVFSSPLFVNNEKIVFEFLHQYILNGNIYWYIASCGKDLNGDGEVAYFYGDNGPDGLFNEPNWGMFDINYKFYYKNITIAPEISPYNDKIYTSKLTYTTCENIQIYWFVSDISKTNVIKIKTNVTGYITEQGYPKDLSGLSYSGISYYSPRKSGWYDIMLYSNGIVVSSINVTVTTSLCPYDMYTYPNPSDINSQIKFYYKFMQVNGKAGLITFCIEPGYFSIADIIISHGVYFLINANESQTLDMQSLDTPWYINMYVEYTPGLYTPILSYTHLVNSPEFSGNEIKLGTPPLQYKSSPFNVVLQVSTDTYNLRISGFHVFLSSSVSVYINNKKIKDVSSLQLFDFVQLIDSSYSGFNNVSLVLETANGSILLDYALFSVATPTTSVETPFSNYIYVFGIGVIAAFILLPLLVSGRIGIEVPTIAYSFFAGIGIVFNAITGWLPVYALFFLTVIVVAVTVYIAFRG